MPMPNSAQPGGPMVGPPSGAGPQLPTLPGAGVPGGLSPEQSQIVQIAISDPAILNAIAIAVSGGGIGEAAGPALASGLSPQSPVAMPQESPNPLRMLG